MPEIKAEEQQFQAREHPRKRGRPRSKLTGAVAASRHTTLVEQTTTSSHTPQKTQTQPETTIDLPISTPAALSTETTRDSQDLENTTDSTTLAKRSDQAELNYEPNNYYAKQMTNNMPGQRKSSRNKNRSTGSATPHNRELSIIIKV